MAIGWIAFACVFGGALLGMFLRGVLPEHHLSRDSKDVVKLGMGLLGTMAALVLGLLIASAKGSFDTQNTEVKQAAAKIVLLDRALAQYGPETKDARDMIRRSVAFRLAVTWPEDGSAPGRFDTPETTPTLERIETNIRDLSPQNDGQRWLQSRALQIASDLQQTRWLLFGGAGDAIQVPFLVLVVANAVPMLGLTAVGRESFTTVFGGAVQLWNDGRELVAGLVLFTAVIAPALQVGFMLAIVLGAQRGRPPRWVGTLLRLHPTTSTWSMIEVMMLGVLVALIKIADYAKVIPGLALFVLGALIFLLAAIQAIFDPREVWSRVEWAAGERRAAAGERMAEATS